MKNMKMSNNAAKYKVLIEQYIVTFKNSRDLQDYKI